MRKLIALALLAGAVLVLPTMAGASDNDVKGPKCADVVGGSGSTTGLVAALAAAPCSSVTYALDVYSDSTMTTKLRTVTVYDLLPENQIGFQVGGDEAGGDGVVCVVLTTSVGGGKHVFDRASDTGCVPVTADSSPGFGDFT